MMMMMMMMMLIMKICRRHHNFGLGGMAVSILNLNLFTKCKGKWIYIV